MLNGRTIENFNEFKSLFYDNKSEIYGTHDWIADRAIYILHDHYPNDLLISSICHNINHMRVYYLYGTEIPDHMINPFKSTKIATEYGTKLTEEDFYKGHSVIMLPNGCISPSCQHIFKSAKIIEDNYKNALYFKNDLQVAAVYLGCMSHLIGMLVLYIICTKIQIELLLSKQKERY